MKYFILYFVHVLLRIKNFKQINYNPVHPPRLTQIILTEKMFLYQNPTCYELTVRIPTLPWTYCQNPHPAMNLLSESLQKGLYFYDLECQNDVLKNPHLGRYIIVDFPDLHMRMWYLVLLNLNWSLSHISFNYYIWNWWLKYIFCRYGHDRNSFKHNLKERVASSVCQCCIKL